MYFIFVLVLALIWQGSQISKDSKIGYSVEHLKRSTQNQGGF
jgi:hypothetical protein